MRSPAPTVGPELSYDSLWRARYSARRRENTAPHVPIGESKLPGAGRYILHFVFTLIASASPRSPPSLTLASHT